MSAVIGSLRGLLSLESSAFESGAKRSIAAMGNVERRMVRMGNTVERQGRRLALGVWTVCYGETKGVQPGDRHSQAECDAMLKREIVSYEAQLDRCLKHPVPMGMKIALVSWTYNVGAGAACRSTLVRLANTGDLIGACNQLPRWNRAGGKVWRGLTNRRMSERQMCLTALEAPA